MRRVFNKTGSHRSRRLLSVFSMVLRIVCFSVIYVDSEEDRSQLIQHPKQNYRMGSKILEK